MVKAKRPAPLYPHVGRLQSIQADMAKLVAWSDRHQYATETRFSPRFKCSSAAPCWKRLWRALEIPTTSPKISGPTRYRAWSGCSAPKGSKALRWSECRRKALHPELPPRVVKTLTDVYREHLATAYKRSVGSGNSQLRDEIRILDQQVTAKRQDVEAFRAHYDAGLADAHEVTPAILRHTYLAFLLQQGARFADIGRIIGRLPQEELAAYMRFASAHPRVPLDQVDPIPPALLAMAGAQG